MNFTDLNKCCPKDDFCDTPSVTIAAIVFYNTPVVQSTLYLGLSSLSKLNLSFEYY
jgi:hypothetical protein